jgi:glyoxylase-like metal-dependent hydrolase (beta-lactamase superfamily II)
MKILTYILGDFATNCYLVIDEKTKKACLIDPAKFNMEIENTINNEGLILEYIILTHGHFDHILGANIFREKTGAKIVAHKAEEEYLRNPKKSLTSICGGGTIAVDQYIIENNILVFGDVSFRVIHTPGHTRGSCCFTCDDESVMFTGDTLFNGSIGRCNFYGGDFEVMISSLQKLKSLNQNYIVYPGHGVATSLDDEKANNPYLREI